MVLSSAFTTGVNSPNAFSLVAVTETVCISVISASVKLIVPVSVNSPVAVTSSVTPPVTSAAATTGTSLVPVMVMVAVEVEVTKFSSLII